MRSVAAGLLIVGSAVLAGCGVDSTEACGRAMAEFGPTLERLAAEIADEGDVLDGLTCDTDGDPVAWLGSTFPTPLSPWGRTRCGLDLSKAVGNVTSSLMTPTSRTRGSL